MKFLRADWPLMSWRGVVGGIEAAKQGHDVIMTPTKYAYFDFYQADPATEPLAMNWAGFTIPLDTVYTFEPVPSELSSEEAKHILGAQANVWTEYISTPEYVEYMVYPRALALAEVVWSSKDRKDIDAFYRRLTANLSHLEMLGVNYRIPDPHEEETSEDLASAQ
jgi:hexosaminidase